MPLATCPRCSKMFDKHHTSVCAKCLDDEDADYEKVRQALAEQPNLTAEELAEKTEVSMDCVLRLLESGRIETVTANKTARCGRCGAPAISLSKKLCEACLNELNTQIAVQQSKIKLPKKRDVELGTALNVQETVDSKRSGGQRKSLLRREED